MPLNVNNEKLKKCLFYVLMCLDAPGCKQVKLYITVEGERGT
jgi:hypothetical protein